MAKVVYCIDPEGVLELARKKIVSIFCKDGSIIVGRYGTNKLTLKNVLKKEQLNG